MNLRTFSTLQIALGLSVAVHAALLTVRLVDPQAFERAFKDTPLEVILVNAKTQAPADQAQAIAQAAMAGGGEATEGRATSPLPSALADENGDALEDETERQLQSLQVQQTLLLTQIRQQIAALKKVDAAEARDSREAAVREQKRSRKIRQLAEIERRIQRENARPKKRYVSPATRQEAYALYYDQLRRLIEARGTENFPEVNGKKLYGELTMVITVNHDGRILATEIAKGSGSRTLDRRAMAIARNAGPFGPFSAAMRRQAEQIEVVSRFRFTRDDTLDARVSAP